MNRDLDQAIAHWHHVAPLLTDITSEAEYDARAAALDKLLDIVGDDEDHPLIALAARMGDTIRHYDESRHSGRERI